MKKTYTILIALFIVGQTFGQVIEKKTNMSLGVQPSLSTDIDNISQKQIIKLWKKFFKPYGKVKRNKKAKEYYSTGVRVNRIKSGDPVDLYMKFNEFADGVNINLCIDLGTGFVSKDNPNEYSGAVDVLDEFVLYVESYKLNEKLEDEEDELDDFESSLKKAKKKNIKYHKNIEKYKQYIMEAEEDIEKNLLEQKSLKKSIQMQLEKIKVTNEEIKNLKK